MNGFVEAALAGMVGNVLSAPPIALIVLRRSFRQDVASALLDARDLRSIYREHDRLRGTAGAASAMAGQLAAQLENATGKLRGHLGLIAYGPKARCLARLCASAAWGIMLSQWGPAEKAEAVADLMELLNTALGSWRLAANSRALKRFPAVAGKWRPDLTA